MRIKLAFIIVIVCFSVFTNCSNNQSSDELFQIGLEKFNQNDLDLAIEFFNESIAKDSTNPNPYNSRGTAKIFKGDSAGALADYSKAIKLSAKKGTFPQAFYNRGVLYFKIGQLENAKNDLSISIAQDWECAECYYNRGLVYLKSDSLTKALEDFSIAYDLNNGYFEAIFFKGNVKQILGDYKGSIEDYDRAIEINKTKEIVYYNRAVSNFALHEYAKALSDCDTVITISPNYAPAYSLQGDVKHDLGQLAAACTLWQKAFDLGDQYAYVMLSKFCK